MPDTRPALVLLSGIGGDEESWAALIPLLEDVADCRPLVATGATIAEMADDILGRAPQRFALAGHSMGGYVALAVQRAAPQRVERLCLINTSAAPDTAEQRDARLALIAAVEKHGYDRMIERLLPNFTAGPVPALGPMLRRAGAERFVREQRATMARPDARPALAQLTGPTLVIGSELDRIVDPDRSREIANHVHQVTLAMLPETGHVAPMEKPERVVALMRAWLA